MKAQFFNKPLNYSLNVDGDIWEQGSEVTGDLTIENTSSEPIDFKNLGCHLCYCQSKKIKAKDPKGVQLIESKLMPDDTLKTSFIFTLDKNCPITDSAGSLQILTGDISDSISCGMMELKIVPIKTITNFIEVFELFFRFKFKNLKNKKEYIETSLTPPATKEWAKIQKMILQMKMDEETLIVSCLVNIKSLSFDNSSSKTKDERKEILLVIPKEEYEFHGSVNQEGIKKHITRMLEQIKLKPIL